MAKRLLLFFAKLWRLKAILLIVCVFVDGGGGGVLMGGGFNWDCSRLLCFYMIVYPKGASERVRSGFGANFCGPVSLDTPPPSPSPSSDIA